MKPAIGVMTTGVLIVQALLPLWLKGWFACEWRDLIWITKKTLKARPEEKRFVRFPSEDSVS